MGEEIPAKWRVLEVYDQVAGVLAVILGHFPAGGRSGKGEFRPVRVWRCSCHGVS